MPTERSSSPSSVGGAGPRVAQMPEHAPVTVETELSDEQAEEFFELYLAAFGPLRARAVARQVLHRDEFLAQMSDPRVWKFIAWSSDGSPAGLSTLTRDLATVPWISPEYFAERYPEHTARSAVYYWGFTLTRSADQHNRHFLAMIRAVAEFVAADGGVCGYDVCAYNNATLNFSAQVETISRRLTDVTFEVLDTQTYYSATLP